MDIRKIKTYFVCPDHDEKYQARCEYMKRLLSDLGFENFHHYKSSHNSYPRDITLATVDILSQNLDEPILLLEDDIEFMESPSFVIDLNCDALYLGLSNVGGHPTENWDEGPSKFTEIEERYVRVMNMLCAHAIVYINRDYKLTIINALKDTYGWNDVAISRFQSKYNIRTLREPLCWQSAKFNNPHQEHATKIRINDDGSTSRF